MGLIKDKGKNSGNFILFVVILAGYLFFLSSRLWLPDMRELIEATPFYEKQPFEDYSVYLTKWDYSEKQRVMELVVEVESKDLLSSQLGCEAVERTAGELNVETVLKDREYQVIRIKDIPEKWREVSIHLKDEEGNSLNLYTNVEAVNRVGKLDEKDRAGYTKERLEGQADYDTYMIRQKEKEIADLTEENRKLEDGIEEMKTKKYPTQEEADKAADLVISAENKCRTNEAAIADRTEEIEALKARTDELHKQIEELE